MASGVQPSSMNMVMDELSEEDSVFEMPDRKSLRELEHLTIEELLQPEEGGPLRDAIEFTKQLLKEPKTAPIDLKDVKYFLGVCKLALKKDLQQEGEIVPFRKKAMMNQLGPYVEFLEECLRPHRGGAAEKPPSRFLQESRTSRLADSARIVPKMHPSNALHLVPSRPSSQRTDQVDLASRTEDSGSRHTPQEGGPSAHVTKSRANGLDKDPNASSNVRTGKTWSTEQHRIPKKPSKSTDPCFDPHAYARDKKEKERVSAAQNPAPRRESPDTLQRGHQSFNK